MTGARCGITGVALLCAAMSTFVGCAKPKSATTVLIVVDTNLSVPEDIDEFVVEVLSPGGVTQTSSANLVNGGAEPPRSLSVAYSRGPLGVFTARARALRAGALVVQREARFTFELERTRVLRMSLLQECVNESCPAGQTCGAAGLCVSNQGVLTEFDGTVPIGMPAASSSTALTTDAGR